MILQGRDRETGVHTVEPRSHDPADLLRPGTDPKEPILATVVVLDIETTGLAPEDGITEVAALRLDIGQDSGSARAASLKSWLNDPGRPIPADVQRLTGITDEMVRGQRVDRDELAEHCRFADYIVAHRATFDRSMLVRRMPVFGEFVWACSLDGIPWRDLGACATSLGALCLEHGFYVAPQHRASADVLALAHLMQCRDDERGGTYWHRLLDGAGADLVAIAAPGAAFEAKDALKAAGCRWDPRDRHWWKAVPEDRVAEEVEELVAIDGVARLFHGTVPAAHRYDETFTPDWRRAA